MTPKELIYELRLNDYEGDKWGTTLNAMFDLCEYMTLTYGYTPAEWEFRPGIWIALDDESYWQDLFSDCTEDELLRLGAFLNRLIEMLDKADISY